MSLGSSHSAKRPAMIKGYSGVPEDKELREDILKAGLKLLISETMSETIEKWNQQHLTYE